MNKLLNLEELGARLRRVDKHLVTLLGKRMTLARQVEEYKRKNHEPIFRASIEDQRLAEVRQWAKNVGLSPNFMQAIFYFIIDEACKVQLIQLQTPHEEERGEGNEEEFYLWLKQNLFGLTEAIAGIYDQFYEDTFFATRSYLKFEERQIYEQISTLTNRGLLVDLGCATGRQTLKLANEFVQLVGFDLSPSMIRRAVAKRQAPDAANVSFVVADIEQGIPMAGGEASLVIMNLGTASDCQDIAGIIQETERVLLPGGRFLFSFYNRQAIVYRWDTLPWPVALAAEVNLVKDCLDVHYDGQVFSVPAHAYTVEEVKALFPPRLQLQKLLTYPTISSILPNEVFDEESVRDTIIELDRQLSSSQTGAYIIATGEKI